jgi:hypothetical protein
MMLIGFITTARMSGNAGSCPLCSTAGGDRLEHFLHCEVFVHFCSAKYPALRSSVGPVFGNLRHTLVTQLTDVG